MKKLFIPLLCLAILCGCGKEESSEPETVNCKELLLSTQFWEKKNDSLTNYSFNEDGTGYFLNKGIEYNLDWELNGSQLTLYYYSDELSSESDYVLECDYNKKTFTIFGTSETSTFISK